MDESMVMVCMQIITNTGSAKSSYIEAIQKAKKGDLGGAEISIIYRFHRRTPRLSRLPNLWRIISLQTGPENAWPGSPGSNFKRGNTVCLKTPCTSIT